MLDVQAKEDPDDVFGRWLWEEMVKKDSKESDSEYEASEVHDHPYQRQAGSVGLHPFAKKQCVYVYIYISLLLCTCVPVAWIGAKFGHFREMHPNPVKKHLQMSPQMQNAHRSGESATHRMHAFRRSDCSHLSLKR